MHHRQNPLESNSMELSSSWEAISRSATDWLLSCCWSSPEQWFLVPSPTGLMTVFYCLTVLGAFRLFQLLLSYSIISHYFIEFEGSLPRSKKESVENIASQLLQYCVLRSCCLAKAVSAGFKILALSKYATVLYKYYGWHNTLCGKYLIWIEFWKQYLFSDYVTWNKTISLLSLDPFPSGVRSSRYILRWSFT
jgi:hypothetical protein